MNVKHCLYFIAFYWLCRAPCPVDLMSNSCSFSLTFFLPRSCPNPFSVYHNKGWHFLSFRVLVALFMQCYFETSSFKIRMIMDLLNVFQVYSDVCSRVDYFSVFDVICFFFRNSLQAIQNMVQRVNFVDWVDRSFDDKQRRKNARSDPQRRVERRGEERDRG